jgi:ubiquinone/menaquinone biosynthesis C-methylase UbiE
VTKYDAREIRGVYERGENIMRWVNAREGVADNSITAILYSYDMQAGSYVEQLRDPIVHGIKQQLGECLAAILDEIAPQSLLEAGTGEATSLVPILDHMKTRPRHLLGFDLSLSRLLFADRHLADHGHHDVVLFTAALDGVPLATGSVDTVLTIHAVEPNHGYERAVLAELLRVTRRHLVMVEPSYEFASTEARARMERLGYVRGLPAILEELGCPARRIERFPFNTNPLNEAALIIVEKPVADAFIAPSFVSPISGRELVKRDDCWHCPGDGHAFPVIAGIPCLTLENAILVSKLGQIK